MGHRGNEDTPECAAGHPHPRIDDQGAVILYVASTSGARDARGVHE
jgi:hypothetical protein